MTPEIEPGVQMYVFLSRSALFHDQKAVFMDRCVCPFCLTAAQLAVVYWQALGDQAIYERLFTDRQPFTDSLLGASMEQPSQNISQQI